MSSKKPPETIRPHGLSGTVRALGVVSLLTDISSEMVYPLNPVFLTRILGAPPWVVGLIEGIAESTASVLKVYAGWLSDRAGRRKPLTVVGYGLGAAAKPMMAIAGAWSHVLCARFVDRVGKGLRSAPRDALITENCEADQRGRAFGFHRSMDTIGAVVGPLCGYALLSRYRGHMRWLYMAAFVPALVGVGVLAVAVRDQTRAAPSTARPSLPRWRDLSPVYRRYLLIVGLFSVGNSSDAFLLLRAQSMGVSIDHLLLLYSAFNLVEAVLAYPVGRLSDRKGRRPLIAAGYLVFAGVYCGFAALDGRIAAWMLFLLYGGYYTLTGGVQRALAADLARPEARAAEIGAFHMLVGLLALPASIVAGYLYGLWQPAPFLVGAGCAVAAAVLMLATRLDKPLPPR